ncbi:hypothetical protein M5689_010782 [Euphorbia peplus]|nr:hypothetical protein M5689_010782 [Euphorbia peplus]
MYAFPNGAHVTHALREFFMCRLRGWRYNLRKVYQKCTTDKERLSKCPSDIDPEKWKWLVNYWGTDKFRKISETNTENRLKQENLACVGTRSIARIATEMRAQPPPDDEIDPEPEYLKLFVKQRQHKDGTWINAKAEKDYNNQLSLHEEQIESFGVDNLSTTEAYTKVLGHKSGYLRDRLKVELEVYTKQKDAEFQQTVIALKNQFKNDMNDEIRKLKEELTSSIPQKMCSSTNLVAHQNDANMHEIASDIMLTQGQKQDSVVARGEKQDSLAEKIPDMSVASKVS